MTTYFYVNNVFMKAAGLDLPPKSKKSKSKLLYYCYSLFWLIYCILVFVPCEFLAYDQAISDLPSLIKSANIIMTHVLGIYKLSRWLTDRARIEGIQARLGSYEDDYEAFEEFEPSVIFAVERRVKNFFSVAFLVMGISVGVSGCTVAFMDLIFVAREEGVERVEALGNLSLAYFSVVPFDYRRSFGKFGFAIVFQLLPLYHYAWYIISCDAMYMGLISYISAHLNLIQGAFRTLRERCFIKLNIPIETEYLKNPPSVQKVMDEEMRAITRHFQTVIRSSAEIEKMYNFTVLLQTFASLVILCTSLYMASLGIENVLVIVKEMCYLCAASVQIFIYCYFGNKVRISSEEIANGIYSMDWYATTTSFKRTMIINIIRSHRGIYFTIGKFTTLTLATFVQVSRGSYSFFAVLKNSS